MTDATTPAEPNREDFGQAIHDLRAAHDQIKSQHGEINASKLESDKKYTELEQKTYALEEQNQKLVTKGLDDEKSRQELTDRIDVFEKRLSRPGVGDEEAKQGMKVFNAYMLKGVEGVRALEFKTLRTDINTDGGFLTTDPEILEEIVKDITEVSPIRQLARVRRTTTESLRVRRRRTLLNSDWKGQLETSDTDTSTYGMMEIPVNKLPITVDITREMLLYEDVSITDEVMQDVAEDFAENEGFAFVLGDAVKKPEGFLVNADVVANAITSASVGVVDGDDFASLMTSLKIGYNPIFGFNRSTWGQIVNLKDSGGQYLINFGDLSAGVSATLRGVPYRIIQDMPDTASGNLSVIAADFNKGYVIADGLRLEMIRDEFTRKKEGVVEFQFTRFVGGQVVQPEAFVPLLIAT